MLLTSTGNPLGLATNGRQWALVHAPAGGTASVAVWETELWFDERLTLRAFQSLLGARRTIGASAGDDLEALFDRSAQDEREVTDQLGLQVRRSIEQLVHAFDRADDDAGGELFRYVDPKTIYEAAVSIAMRLVFLLAAEARGLLPDDEAWIESYAVSPLRDQLEETKIAAGEELLERRFDAWPRLLATFRAVHGGVEHDRLRLPGYGGGLFDPARFPFLEGVDGRAAPGSEPHDPQRPRITPDPGGRGAGWARTSPAQLRGSRRRADRPYLRASARPHGHSRGRTGGWAGREER